MNPNLATVATAPATSEPVSSTESVDAVATPESSISASLRWTAVTILEYLTRPVPEEPTERRRDRSRRYYLRQQSARRRLHRGVLIGSIIVCLSSLIAAALFFADVIRDYFSDNSAFGGVMVLVALFSVIMGAVSIHGLRQLCREAAKYADFVLAVTNDHGELVVKDVVNGDPSYLRYCELFGGIILRQPEFYSWFTTGFAPVREVPRYL